MSIILATDEQILKCLSDGYNVIETIKKCHCSVSRIVKLEKRLKERGKTINKYGKTINTIDGQKKKSSGFKRIEFLDRSIKKNWKKYMLENPFYFKEVFNKDLNRKNLIKAANEMFGERIV